MSTLHLHSLAAASPDGLAAVNECKRKIDMSEILSKKRVHTVRFEPVGVELEVEEGEWILDAAFRQGIAVPHGCREGQCNE